MKTFFVLSTLLFAFTSTYAMDLETARANQLVVELPTGYVKAVDKKVKALADEVNLKRKVHYEEIAKKNKLPIDQIASQAAKKISEKVQSKPEATPSPTVPQN